MPQCSLSVWIVPGEQSVAGLVNHGCHARAKGSGPSTSANQPPNVQLVQRFNPVLTMNHVTLPHAVDLVVIAVMLRGAEVYLCHGDEYMLFKQKKE